MREIEAFYSQRKGAKVVQVLGMDEFLSVDNDDDIVGVVPAVPAPGDVPIQEDTLVQAVVSTQADVPAPVDVLHKLMCAH